MYVENSSRRPVNVDVEQLSSDVEEAIMDAEDASDAKRQAAKVIARHFLATRPPTDKP